MPGVFGSRHAEVKSFAVLRRHRDIAKSMYLAKCFRELLLASKIEVDRHEFDGSLQGLYRSANGGRTPAVEGADFQDPSRALQFDCGIEMQCVSAREPPGDLGKPVFAG